MDDSMRQLEEQIIRSLDGELGDDEQLALNRALIRNPASQELYDSFRRVHGATTAALCEAVPERATRIEHSALSSRRDEAMPYRSRRGLWLIPGAIAAALLAVAVHRALGPQQDLSAVANRQQPASLVPSALPPSPQRYANQNAPFVRTLSDTPLQRVRRGVDRQFLGIRGDDDRIYLIEVNRIRTLKRPKRLTKEQLRAGEIM